MFLTPWQPILWGSRYDCNISRTIVLKVHVLITWYDNPVMKFLTFKEAFFTEVFTLGKLQQELNFEFNWTIITNRGLKIFWNATPCSLVEHYQRFGRFWFPFLQGFLERGGSSSFIRNVGKFILNKSWCGGAHFRRRQNLTEQSSNFTASHSSRKESYIMSVL